MATNKPKYVFEVDQEFYNDVFDNIEDLTEAINSQLGDNDNYGDDCIIVYEISNKFKIKRNVELIAIKPPKKKKAKKKAKAHRKVTVKHEDDDPYN